MSDLDRLFYWRGIAPDFYNFRGEHTDVPIENRIQLLQAMGVDVSTNEKIAEEAFLLDVKPWQSRLAPLEVLQAPNTVLGVNFEPDELSQECRWELLLGDTCVVSGECQPRDLNEIGDYVHNGVRYSRRALDIGRREPNYYIVRISCAGRVHESRLAICPETAYLADWHHIEDAKPWGFVVQLYTLRSERNWGIGDFSDLMQLIELSSKRGVDVIGLNPFHALQANLSTGFSPYAPSDRRYLNPLYIDVDIVDGYDASYRPGEEIHRLKELEHVNYEAVRAAKYRQLFNCFEHLNSETLVELGRFVESSAPSLVHFAAYEALTGWTPDELVAHSVSRETLIACLLDPSQGLTANVSLTAFYCYLQWLAEKQLKSCQERAISLGMKVGLVRDLAVGADGGGAEVQTNGGLFCHDASIGAPPDPLALTGQNWGIPPMDPAELRRTGFQHFIDLLKANMSHCGALRIDHAMSLFRLWWCPPKESPEKGAYIYYPFHELLGLLCLESHLNKCVVVAEDLGIVPEEFRQAMLRTKLYSNRVFYFEKWNDEEFKHPHQYEAHALAMLDNHDVPTIVSWWNGTDLSLREELNLLGAEGVVEEMRHARDKEKQHVLNMLAYEGYLPEAWHTEDIHKDIDEALCGAIVQFVSSAASKFFILQLEDLLMMNDPVNVPGTYLEHKNWSRKLTKNIKDIFDDPRVDSLLKSVNAIRNK